MKETISLVIEIEKELHRKLRRRAANEFKSVKDLVTPVLVKLVSDEK